MGSVYKMNKGNSLKKKLRKKLNWYTMYASGEEYDEKAVESILYLLDTLDPLDEADIPDENMEWEKFQKLAGQKELLPLGEAVTMESLSESEKVLAGCTIQGEDFMTKEETTMGGENTFSMGSAVGTESGRMAALSGVPGNSGKTGWRKRKLVAFILRHKAVVAAACVLLLFTVGNSIHAVANPETGFFFWLERDESGIEMMTSPEEIVDLTDTEEQVFYDKEDIPQWGRAWLQITEAVKMPKDYRWQYFETNELVNRKVAISYYFNKNLEKSIVFGVLLYMDKITYYREEFTGYSYVDSYKGTQNQSLDIYSREEKGKVFYIISFYEGKCKYYLRGQDNLEELKALTEEYWKSVQSFQKSL